MSLSAEKVESNTGSPTKNLGNNIKILESPDVGLENSPNIFKFKGNLMEIFGKNDKTHIFNTQDNTVAVLICSRGSWSTNYQKNPSLSMKYLMYPPLVKYILQKYDENDTPEDKIFNKEEIKEMIVLSEDLAKASNRSISLWKKAYKEVLSNLYVVFVERLDPFTITLSDDGEEKIINPSSFIWNKFTMNDENVLTEVLF
jgi:hypothetical protein